MFKAEPVDQNGNLIDRHNLWEMVGVRYRRSLFPGFTDQAEFTFACPGTPLTGSPATGPRERLDRSLQVRVPRGQVTELQVSARVMYRKADQFLLNFLFGAKSGLTAPVTEMSSDHKTIRVTGAD